MQRLVSQTAYTERRGVFSHGAHAPIVKALKSLVRRCLLQLLNPVVQDLLLLSQAWLRLLLLVSVSAPLRNVLAALHLLLSRLSAAPVAQLLALVRCRVMLGDFEVVAPTRAPLF